MIGGRKETRVCLIGGVLSSIALVVSSLVLFDGRKVLTYDDAKRTVSSGAQTMASWLASMVLKGPPVGKAEARRLETNHTLIGRSKAEVLKRVGEPIALGPFTWVYCVQKCFWLDDVGFWIEFDREERVISARVGDVDQEGDDHYESLKRRLMAQTAPLGG